MFCKNGGLWPPAAVSYCQNSDFATPPLFGKGFKTGYRLAQDNVILSKHPITVEPDRVKFTASPSMALSAQKTTAEWDGPDYSRDYIGISNVDEKVYLTYTHSNAGNPMTVQLPDAAGAYEICCFLGRNGVILDAVQLTVAAD